MTNDINLYLTVATSSLVGLAMVTTAGLSGWRGWLALKREQLGDRNAAHAPETTANTGNAASRIEMADLKERIRKLEAIAAGVDL